MVNKSLESVYGPPVLCLSGCGQVASRSVLGSATWSHGSREGELTVVSGLHGGHREEEQVSLCCRLTPYEAMRAAGGRARVLEGGTPMAPAISSANDSTRAREAGTHVERVGKRGGQWYPSGSG